MEYAYYSFPVLNTHRRASRTFLTIETIDKNDPDAMKLFRGRKDGPDAIRFGSLDEVAPAVAEGREGTMAPPSVSCRPQASFVEHVLRLAKVPEELHKETLRVAFDEEAKARYVLPNEYTPITNIGWLSKDAAERLVRPRPCGDKAELKSEFVTWDSEFPLDLAYREVRQVLLRIRVVPVLLRINLWAAAAEGPPVKLGDFVLPVARL